MALFDLRITEHCFCYLAICLFISLDLLSKVFLSFQLWLITLRFLNDHYLWTAGTPPFKGLVTYVVEKKATVQKKPSVTSLLLPWEKYLKYSWKFRYCISNQLNGLFLFLTRNSNVNLYKTIDGLPVLYLKKNIYGKSQKCKYICNIVLISDNL